MEHKLYTYDTEVFAHDFLFVAKDFDTGEYFISHNDGLAVRDFIQQDCIYAGFNSKRYDQFIIKAICTGCSPEEVKAVNDFIIIEDGNGWDCPQLENVFYRFNNIDIMDDMQVGLSLKAIEGHMGTNIEESEVDFNIDRPLTQQELKQTIHYCKHDVDATEEVIKLRMKYLENKVFIGKLAGLDEIRSLSLTNAKLTSAMLKAQAPVQPRTDGRAYTYPENLRREYIPEEVFRFFDRLHDPSIPDEKIFSEKLNITIGDCPVTLGYGGIHGAIPHYLWEEGEPSES